nr:tyrosinase-like protein orsc [Quercus suber]
MKPTVMTAAEAPNYPGVKSRYDEYVATHINYTYNIHDTADFFSWHRTFIHFLEKDLQTLCGYTGTLPYWNWALDADAPQNSSLFNGDAYSLGSNGKYIPNRKSTYLYIQGINMPPGTGGGCVTSGPFTSYTVNLGPLSLASTPNVNSSFQYNPRCLARDINPFFTKQYNRYDNVTRLLLESNDIQTFQSVAQGYAGANNKFGVHGGAHYAVGTGVGSMADFNSSPADPVFYLHHAMVDFIWSNWQWLDYQNRANALQGTSTLGNNPPSNPMTLNDMLPFGFVAPAVRFGDVMDHFGGLNGSLCYRYQ